MWFSLNAFDREKSKHGVNDIKPLSFRECVFCVFLSADKSITVFAPYDAAFAKLSPGVVEYLLSHPQELKSMFLICLKILVNFSCHALD